MTAAERATLRYSRGQMFVSMIAAVMLGIIALALVRVGVGYGVFLLFPVFVGLLAMYVIGYNMHNAAAKTVIARHDAERLTVAIGTKKQQSITYAAQQELYRNVLRWWSGDTSRTSFRATQNEFRISQDTWNDIREAAVMAGMAQFIDGPTGRELRWTSSQAQTVKLTADFSA